MISRYAGDSTRHQTGAGVTGLPVEHSGTRYTPTAQPCGPVALGLQVGCIRSGHALGIPGGVCAAKDSRSRLACSDRQPATIIHAEQHRRHGLSSAAIAHDGHSSQPGIRDQDRRISALTTRPTCSKA
ncbi:terminal protein, TpgR1 [Streptomyces viridosporus ATCC 14672]|uniref:Terminal protein, TpgR1 n=1 Tax=Streptomyces viridosporus (strain ATCC 14672 / DSM 40746 / JCM 4963 / KCTC 9882 / NRRL B-12104 / FH 1290) TaxID=566461 RepID=D6AA69_STRV1|nr:terminal protein, TpgR1 [Streptomyces viridosporus ATCC 14672]